MNPQDILGLISRLGEERNSNGNPDLLNSMCTLTGGLLGGPTGMVIGGLAGSALNTIFNPNQNQRYRRPQAQPQPISRSELSNIIENRMNDEQRRKLAQMVRKILRENPNSNMNIPLQNDGSISSLIGQVTTIAQNMGRNSGGSNSNRQRLGSYSSQSQAQSSCSCRRGSCS